MNKTRKKSFWRQLIQSFILVIMIPVLFLGGFIFYSAHQYIQEQRMTESMNLIQQNQQNLDSWAKQCESSVRYLAANYTLQEFLQMDESQYVAVNQSARVVSTVLYGVLLSTRDYEKITVYTDKESGAMSNLLENSREVREEKWYKDILATSGIKWWHQNHRFYVGKKITTTYPVKVIGVLVIEIKESAFSDKLSMLENVPAIITVWDDGESICEYTTGGYFEKSGLIKKLEWGDTGWLLDYKIDKGYYHQNPFWGLGAPMIVICIVLTLALLSMRFLSRFLVRDLNLLVESVNEVQNGNLDAEQPPSGIYEIHILSESIREMLSRIKSLIHQVYDKEIERQRLELNLLQSKISPHFLYNNLSVINWLAIDCGEEKISEIVTEMAVFYRTALNKGKTVDALRVEMENIRAYIHLVLCAHEKAFGVSYAVDESMMDIKIPTFILQPLVENAIEHGINQLEKENGEIRISAECKGEELILKVFDNGKSLYGKIGEGILKKENYGYGTGNVDKRIKLLFGTEYGLTVSADTNGTTSMIRLKNQMLQET